MIDIKIGKRTWHMGRQDVAIVCAATATLAVGGLLGLMGRRLTPGGGIGRLLISGPILGLSWATMETVFPLVYLSISGEEV